MIYDFKMLLMPDVPESMNESDVKNDWQITPEELKKIDDAEITDNDEVLKGKIYEKTDEEISKIEGEAKQIIASYAKSENFPGQESPSTEKEAMKAILTVLKIKLLKWEITIPNPELNFKMDAESNANIDKVLSLVKGNESLFGTICWPDFNWAISRLENSRRESIAGWNLGKKEGALDTNNELDFGKAKEYFWMKMKAIKDSINKDEGQWTSKEINMAYNMVKQLVAENNEDNAFTNAIKTIIKNMNLDDGVTDETPLQWKDGLIWKFQQSVEETYKNQLNNWVDWKLGYKTLKALYDKIEEPEAVTTTMTKVDNPESKIVKEDNDNNLESLENINDLRDIQSLSDLDALGTWSEGHFHFSAEWEKDYVWENSEGIQFVKIADKRYYLEDTVPEGKSIGDGENIVKTFYKKEEIARYWDVMTSETKMAIVGKKNGGNVEWKMFYTKDWLSTKFDWTFDFNNPDIKRDGTEEIFKKDIKSKKEIKRKEIDYETVKWWDNNDSEQIFWDVKLFEKDWSNRGWRIDIFENWSDEKRFSKEQLNALTPDHLIRFLELSAKAYEDFDTKPTEVWRYNLNRVMNKVIKELWENGKLTDNQLWILPPKATVVQYMGASLNDFDSNWAYNKGYYAGKIRNVIDLYKKLLQENSESEEDLEEAEK